jgi:hypothetical protein
VGEIFAFESTTAVLVSIDEANILMVRFSKQLECQSEDQATHRQRTQWRFKVFCLRLISLPLLVLTLDPSARSTQY